jgi:hypothetical protein
MLKGLDSSAVQYIEALSPGLHGLTGSTTAYDLSKATFCTVLVTAGCISSSFTVNVERSATSNGTYATFGASFPALTAGSESVVRSFVVGGSQPWYRASYIPAAGSATAAILFVAQGQREVPIDQDASFTSYSVVAST